MIIFVVQLLMVHYLFESILRGVRIFLTWNHPMVNIRYSVHVHILTLVAGHTLQVNALVGMIFIKYSRTCSC